MANKLNSELTEAQKEERKERAKQRAEMRAKAALAPVDLNKRYPVETALAILNTSRATFYAGIKQDRIKVFKVGRRTYIAGRILAELSRAPDESVAA